MKKFIRTLIILFMFVHVIVFADTKKEVNMYLFYGDGCPHCKALEKYLDGYLKEKNNIKLYTYEVWNSEENLNKLKDVMEIMGSNNSGIPYLVIGSSYIVGFDETYTPSKIKSTVSYYEQTKYKDKVGIYLGLVEDSDEEEEEQKEQDREIVIPIIGKVDIRKASILLCSIVIGLVDGFNPCAMWILLFLISMLLGMKNKKRKWILGITFLLSSAVVYFLFLISWLNLATFLNKIEYIRAAIAMIAITFGVISIVNFLKSLNKDDGCEVVDTTNRKRIIKAIKKIVKEESFILALLGIVLLAFSVNIIELLCSLGLPVMFSEILAVNEISNTMKIVYSLIYVFFFLIDDIVVFIIAMKTLEIKAISNKFGKYSHLIGGIIMIIIGFLMVYKPEWLMFNF